LRINSKLTTPALSLATNAARSGRRDWRAGQEPRRIINRGTARDEDRNKIAMGIVANMRMVKLSFSRQLGQSPLLFFKLRHRHGSNRCGQPIQFFQMQSSFFVEVLSPHVYIHTLTYTFKARDDACKER
jgi:hypothetical protein